MDDLDRVEGDIRELVAGYRRDGLVDAAIYGMPSLAWPGAPKHDFLCAVNRSKSAVGLYLRALEGDPRVLDDWPALAKRHTGKVTLTFKDLDDDVRADLVALLDRLHAGYVDDHRG